MLRRLLHTTAACLFACQCAVSASQAAGPGIQVGSIADLDLEQMKRIIGESDDSPRPATSERRALSLEESIKVSLESNLQLQIRELVEEGSGQAVRAARAKFHPVAGVSGGASGRQIARSDREDERFDDEQAELYLRQEVPTGGTVKVLGGFLRDFKDENSDVAGAPNVQRTSEIAGFGIEARQPLLRGGRVFVARRQILDASYDNEISRAELQGEILLVTARTKAAYYQVVRAERQVEVIEQALERDRELVEASRALFEAGRVSKVDVLSAEINQANDLARIASGHADLEVQQNELRRVLGLPIDTQIDVTDRTLPFEPVEIRLKEWIARAVENRPEMMKLRSQLEQAELAIRVQNNGRLPSLDVYGRYRPDYRFESFEWAAGLGFEMPLGNVEPRARLKQSELEHLRLKREQTRTRRDIELEVRETEIRLRENLQRLRSLAVGVESARSKREIARGRFEMGLANNLDITNADEELIQAESQLLSALADYATNLAFLEARIAGPL